MLIGTYNAQDIEQLRQRHPDRPQALERLIGQPDLDGVYHIDTHGDPWREWHGQKPLIATAPSTLRPSASLFGKAVSFTKAIASRVVYGRVELPIFQQRANQCHGDAATAPCSARAFNATAAHHYCTECGCGEDTKLSQAGSTPDWPILIPAGSDYDDAPYLKLMYPSVDCPRRREGFSNAFAVASRQIKRTSRLRAPSA